MCAHHGEEDAELGVHVDDVAVSEDELRASLLLARQHDRDLLGGHRQRRQLDAIELVETAPRPGHRQTCTAVTRTATAGHWLHESLFQLISYSLFICCHSRVVHGSILCDPTQPIS